jgi:hypothetical protein
LSIREDRRPQVMLPVRFRRQDTPIVASQLR